jgi:hypothetical protein
MATPRPRPSVLASCLLLAVLASASAAKAVKTDTVKLINGDFVTGEIKSLNRGQLTYKTDSMETITVKWEWVARLASPNWFLVTGEDGTQYFGQLHAADEERTLAVGTFDSLYSLPMEQVVRIERIKESLWERVELSLNLGFSYTRASDVAQLTFDGRTSYRDRIHYGEIKLSTIQTDKGNEGTSNRFDAIATYERTLNGRLFGAGQLGGQSNDELGLQLRLLTTAGLGYRLLEANTNVLTVLGGLSLNREWSTTGEQTENNLEAQITSSYSLFIYETPKTDLQLDASLFPSLWSDRLRAEVNASLRREIVKDFFITFSYYESYDSDPLSETAANSDRGIVLQVGWTK